MLGGCASNSALGSTAGRPYVSFGSPDLRAASDGGDLWLDQPYHDYLTGALEAFKPGATTPFLTAYMNSGELLPCDLAFDKAGNIYVSRQPNSRTLSTKGGVVTVFPPGGVEASHELESNISWPEQIAFDSKGTLYVNNVALTASYVPIGWVSEYSPLHLRFIRKIKGITPYSFPLSLAFDRRNDLYVAFTSNQYVNGAEVRVFPPGSTTSTRKFVIPHIYPWQIELDRNGDIYVLNASYGSFVGSVSVYSPAGKLLRTITDGIYGPVSIAVDSSGNLFVANY